MKKKSLVSILVVVFFIGYASGSESDVNDHFGQDFHKGSGTERNNYPAMTTGTSEELKKKYGIKQPSYVCPKSTCPNVYRPICASVNGIPLTAPTMCNYNQKILCYKKMLEPGEVMPTFRLLHDGPCNGYEGSILRPQQNHPQVPSRRVVNNGQRFAG